MTPRSLVASYEPKLFARLFGKEPRWNDLRRIGNSSVARASVIMPVIGYMILFNSEIIGLLKIHSDFCRDCSISWRLYMLYFSSCSFAVGAILYSMFCPSTVKLYAGARDYFEGEKTYYSSALNLGFLFELLEKAGAPAPDDPTNLRSRVQNNQSLSSDEIQELSALMGQFYFVENRKNYRARVSVFATYALGFLLLAIPAIVTFLKVLATITR
jgi:hypothetical protein